MRTARIRDSVSWLAWLVIRCDIKMRAALKNDSFSEFMLSTGLGSCIYRYRALAP